MGRKIGHMEEKDGTTTAHQTNPENPPNHEDKNNANPSILHDENSENLDENAILNVDNMYLYDTSKTVEAKSDQQSNHQKDALISPNSTISVPSSQNDDNYAIEEG